MTANIIFAASILKLNSNSIYHIFTKHFNLSKYVKKKQMSSYLNEYVLVKFNKNY
jgi:hypothetical protein